MKRLFQFFLGAILFCTPFTKTTFAQVMNPNDPVVEYTGGNLQQPPWGQVADWVKTTRLNWNTDDFKAYIFQGHIFRLKFPKSYQHNVNDGKTYPLFIFFHGLGESGDEDMYDNEYQLFHGGQLHRDSVNSGAFDGFLLYMQNQYGFFGNAHFDALAELIQNHLVPDNKVDINRVIVNGLSGGGTASWDFALRHPRLTAACLPISAAVPANANTTNANILKYIPIWLFQGGRDNNPAPATARGVVNNLLNAGANISYTEYPNRGHSCWYDAWNEPGYFPFLRNAHKANPIPLGRKHEFCVGENVNLTLGLTAGFDGYQWRKNGVVITGATSNTLVLSGSQAATFGTYEARIRRGTTWSEWSPNPIVVKLKDPTTPPDITAADSMSRVIPAPDGNTSVTLVQPEGYLTYAWQRVGSPGTISNNRTMTTSVPGEYVVRVTEEFGCLSENSAPFRIVNANGPNKPDKATNLLATPVSITEIKLDWSDNPVPANNETGFEIYMGTAAGGPYKLVGVTSQDVTTHVVNGLQEGTRYYFIIRAINETGAAPVSDEISCSTVIDTAPPTAPGNLKVTATSDNSISLTWSHSTDNFAGTIKYEIYINGVKSYVTDNNSFTCYNLAKSTYYDFTVKAKDVAGNYSLPSNKAVGYTVPVGLTVSFYMGSFTQLPDFATLAPMITAGVSNLNLSSAGVPSNLDGFACLWEGFINIPVSGNYTFRLNSDDGSRMWLAPYSYSASPLVDNDGMHTAQNADGTIFLNAGAYPISIAYFNADGPNTFSLQWRVPGSGSFVAVPSSSYRGAVPAVPAINAPSNITANGVSFDRINISWTDNSNNETGFNVLRSTNPISGFFSVGALPANSTSFTDSIGLEPGTTYYYRVTAEYQYGSSAILAEPEAAWQFNNDFSDASVNGKEIQPSGNPSFNSTNKMEGSHSLSFNGTSQYLNVETSNNDYIRGGYSQKTVSFWMRSASNTGNRMVFDLGGNDDGLAMRLDGNTIYAGIASGNTRRSISAPYNYGSTVWNFITLVYNANVLQLYINGNLAASNQDLGYASGSVGSTSNASRIAGNNSSNAFNISSGLGLFSGQLDNFRIYGSALSASEIQSVMNNIIPGANAATQSLPAAPAIPVNVLAKGISNSAINITWSDVSNETKYELYRSGDDNSNYVLLATLPANSTSYTDNGLYASAIYYYKLKAINFGGTLGFSNEDSASSYGHLPQLTVIEDQYMRFGSQLQLNIDPVYTGNGTRTLTVGNLPAGGWASFTLNGDGTGVITFNPAIANQGTYPNIVVTATDGNSGSTQISFQLVVNDNYSPVIGNINDVTLNESQTSQFNISATDQNVGDVLTWSFTGLPAFASVTPNGNSVQLNLAPGYADNGTYEVIARAEDQDHGFHTRSFSITVNDVNPNRKIYINFTDGTYQAPAPWNNTNRQPSNNNGNFPGMNDETGASTSIGLQITSAWQNMGNGSNNLGVNTNSGVYPNQVIRSAYWSDVTQQNIRIYGLDVNSKYSFTFFGSRGGVNNNRTTNYTIGGQTVSLQAANNSQNTVSISNVQPEADGSLVLNIKNGSGSTFSYINALVIESVYDDGTAPAKPKNLSVQLINGKPGLTWNDVAYNETAYEVYRSTSLAGPFSLLTPNGNNADLEQYDDNNVDGNTTYYYAVRAVNSYGNSPYTDTVSVTTGNGTPVLSPINDVTMKTEQVVNINLSVSDDAGDVIMLEASGLPSFATLTDNGNGTGTIHIAPGNVTGNFNDITVTARDDKGASATRQFKISVADKDITSIYVNFNEVVLPLEPHWNSTNGVGYGGKTLTNLKDETNTTTGVSLTIVDAWEGANDLGVTTGNNSGVFPDNVMRTVYYESTSNAKRIRISGLSSTNKYNLVFFASRSAADNRTTVYSAGGNSVSLNAANNSMNTVQINGLVPDANGVIEFTAQKGSGSSFAYLGAIVIQSYIDNGMPLAPANLSASAKSKTTIELNWNDKSGNEDGFEIFRSTSYDGTYTLIHTTAPNVTTFTDAGLNNSSVYYYKVRGKKAPFFFSSFSNIAGASPYALSVYINFNRQNNATAPWNNTSRAPELNRVFSNLRNDLNNNTGLAMTITENFSGDNPSGMNTGNNSGVVPDNVMRSSWWVDYGLTSQLKISNLNHNWSYTFVFFASRDGGGDRTSVYTINGQSVSLNASFNTSQTVQIENVRPDENGEVYISVSLGQYAQYAYLNGMIIHGYQNSGETTGTEVDGQPLVSTQNGQAEATTETAERRIETEAVTLITNAGVYPNPFRDQLTVVAKFEKDQENVTIQLVDMTGRVITQANAGKVSKGYWNYRLDLSDKTAPGVYLLQIITPENRKQPVTFKLVRTK